MSRIAVYTAIAGRYDHLRIQVEQTHPVEWFAFTDDLSMDCPEPWWLHSLPPHDQGPRMAAKVARCLPARFLPSGYDYAVWIDGNMAVTNPDFATEAVAAVRNGVATWRHPQRTCIYAEADASLQLAPLKYAHQPIREQVAHYRSEGHPRDGGLYATGTTVWDLRDSRALSLGAAWLAECERWTYQDQLSFPVVCRRLDIEPGVFPYAQINGDSLMNPWLRIEPHLRED